MQMKCKKRIQWYVKKDAKWYSEQAVRIDQSVVELKINQYEFAQSIGAKRWIFQNDRHNIMSRNSMLFGLMGTRAGIFMGLCLGIIVEKIYREQDNDFKKSMRNLFGNKFCNEMNPDRYPI